MRDDWAVQIIGDTLIITAELALWAIFAVVILTAVLVMAAFYVSIIALTRRDE